jgi:tRNA A37 threonylcarbamoyladenosine synthetase subunit TsaC/SUA5/YrdC
MILSIHPKNPDERKIKQAVDILMQGGIIIYPTDTVYGLGCSIYQPKALEKIYQLKNMKPEKSHLSFICNDLEC